MINLNFNSEYILENDVVSLRPLTMDNMKHLLPFAINEPDLWTYSLISGAGEEGFKNYVSFALAEKEKQKAYPFIVFDKRTQQYAGSTRFYDFHPSHQAASLGYTWYGKEFHGTGLNKNCKYLLLKFAFEYMKLERLEFRADHNNKRSIAAMQSIGCIVEGVLRSNCKAIEGRRDSIVLSILKDEWQNSVKAMLKRKIQ